MQKLTVDAFSEQSSNLEIDAFLCSSSFEKRCFTIPSIIKVLKPKQSFIFYIENEHFEVIDNAHQLKIELGKKAQLISLDSAKPIINYKSITQVISGLIDDKNLNIFIDCTTFTHETLLILLRLLYFYKTNLGKIYFGYNDSTEYSFNVTEIKDKWLTKGIQEIRTVVGYPGYTDPTQPNHLMILFGFEVERIKKIIDAFEFDKISLGFGEQFKDDKHFNLNKERFESLSKEYRSAEIFSFSLIDPFVTKNQILSYLKREKFLQYNTVIAPLNNKLSTIGAGLASMDYELIQITYAKPNFYNTKGYSIPGKYIYFFTL